jgi:hypothetical protein
MTLCSVLIPKDRIINVEGADFLDLWSFLMLQRQVKLPKIYLLDGTYFLP